MPFPDCRFFLQNCGKAHLKLYLKPRIWWNDPMTIIVTDLRHFSTISSLDSDLLNISVISNTLYSGGKTLRLQSPLENMGKPAHREFLGTCKFILQANLKLEPLTNQALTVLSFKPNFFKFITNYMKCVCTNFLKTPFYLIFFYLP
jgi:hypothetical protein